MLGDRVDWIPRTMDSLFHSSEVVAVDVKPEFFLHIRLAIINSVAAYWNQHWEIWEITKYCISEILVLLLIRPLICAAFCSIQRWGCSILYLICLHIPVLLYLICMDHLYINSIYRSCIEIILITVEGLCAAVHLYINSMHVLTLQYYFIWSKSNNYKRCMN